MNELALFAGAGGGILGGHLLGWRTVCAVEFNAYARSVLLARQNDGTFPSFPIWDDIRTFDGRPWRGIVDVVSGGFPCQDISVAGKGDGLDGERSGLWTEMARVVREVRPRFVFVENSPMLTSRGLDRVLGDLAAMGFNAEWGVLGADNVGAPHRRKRIWIVGYADNDGQFAAEIAGSVDARSNGGAAWKKQASESAGSSQQFAHVADAGSQHEQGEFNGIVDSQIRQIQENRSIGSRGNGIKWWEIEPELGRVADGVAHRVDRLKAIGNGQVPAVAATAWKILSDKMH